MIPRKSDFEQFNWCPKSFEILVIRGVEPSRLPYVMQVGDSFHHAHAEFYGKLNFKHLDQLGNNEIAIRKYFRGLLLWTKDERIRLLCDNFANMETKRWIAAVKEKGIQAPKYFKPVLSEVALLSLKLRRRGHPDRVDLTFDDEYAVGEVKTGHVPKDLSSYRRECVWYLEILEDVCLIGMDGTYDNLEPFRLPKPPKYLFVYFPLDNTVIWEVPNPWTRKALKRREKKFWHHVRNDIYPRLANPFCRDCLVVDTCVDEWGGEYT